MNKTKRLNVAVEPKIIDDLNDICRRQDRRLSSLVREIIRRGICAERRAEAKRKGNKNASA